MRQLRGKVEETTLLIPNENYGYVTVAARHGCMKCDDVAIGYCCVIYFC